jgi:adenylyl-sulfate kinase
MEIDYSLLTDGLKAEREQGITIDVAYRYFSTPKRKFIIADTPGHEQYTRNMATGASTANLAIVLIDARYGVLVQSKRHSFIASLLGIPHFVIAINKMDLVDYRQDVFDSIKADYQEFAAKLGVRDLHFVPISALKGDNVVEPGTANMPWYHGTPLLEYLETVFIASDRNLIDFRFPVQTVSRPNLDFRGFCGQIASGIVRKGDEIMVLPSRKKSRIKSIVTFDGELTEAFPPQSVNLTLDDEVDVSRGDMLVHPNNLPRIERHFEAMLVWMGETPLDPRTDYLIKHTSQMTRVRIDEVRYKIDVNTLRKNSETEIGLNEIGRVVLTSVKPIFFDPYTKNRQTGCFILIDRISNNTVAAGMIIDRVSEDLLPSKIANPSDIRQKNPSLITPEERVVRFRQKPVTLWLTGLHASGKKLVAYRLEKRLFECGAVCVVLEGGRLRAGISRELDFSSADRAEHLRRVAEIARTLNESGLIAVCAFVSPDAGIRRQVSEIVGSAFVEVHVHNSIENCRKRDAIGLYEKADGGKITNLPGINAPYEEPENPAIRLDMNQIDEDAAVEIILEHLKGQGIFPI